jgi:hypothetical protein
MIKFEEHEGQLFRMLDKPVPLTDDTELPVLVRMIQNDTMLGKANKRSCHPDALAIKIICIELTDGGLFLDGHYTYRYEIIGIPVAEGSSEWRNYQLVQGKCVYCPGDSEYYQASGQGRIIGKIIENNEFNSTWNSDTFMRDDSDGWQIYKEQKPLLADAKVGDLVKLRNGSYSQIAEVKDGSVFKYQNPEVIERSRVALSRPHGLPYFGVMKMVTPADGELQDTDYTKEGFVRCMAKTGWQIYEEPKQPKPKYRVGDSVICEYHRSPLPKQVSYERIIDINDVTIVTQSQNGSVCEYDINGNHGDINGWHIDRVISPSEHIITIGCLSGTVEPVSTNGIHVWFHLIGVDDKTIATIRISSLDTPTRELVESLLEAQGEGDKPCES